MATFNWQVGSGAFNVGGNWTVNGATSATPPGTADTAIIGDTLGGTISGTGTVATLDFNPGAPWTVTGQISGGNIGVNTPTTIASGGVLTLTSGFASVANANGTTSTLTINSGGVLNCSIPSQNVNYLLDIGGFSTTTGANGTLVVQGANASVNMNGNGAAVGIGAGDSGTLRILSGASASFGTSGSANGGTAALSIARQGQGSVLVDGAGSHLQLAGTVYAGRAAGTNGSVTVSNGASLTETTVSSGVSNSFGSSGTLNSTFLSGGTGTLTVASGGTATFADGISFGVDGSTGLAAISGGTLNVGGIVRLGSGSTLGGSTGIMTITAGGAVHITAPSDTTTNYIQIAGTANDAGSATVDGAGSLLDAGANGISVGNAGNGALTVKNGGHVTSSSADSRFESAFGSGNLAGSQGTTTITGAGSAITAAGYVYVGRAGNATLLLDQGATFTGGSAATGSGTGANAAFGIAIGDGTPNLDGNGNPNTSLNYGGSGTAEVIDGSTLRSLDAIRVGYRGTTGTLLVGGNASAIAAGQLTVGGGTDRPGGTGEVIVGNLGTIQAGGQHINGTAGISIGAASGASGLVGVFGAGSSISANGDRLTLGSNGTGGLIVGNGATVSSGASYSDSEAALAVGAAGAGVGQLLVTGAGSTLTAAGLAVIGGNNTGSGLTPGGIGLIAVSNGGTLATGGMGIFAGSGLQVGAGSQATIGGNLLSIGSIANSGTLTVAGLSIATMTIGGGLTDVYAPFASSFAMSGADTTLRVHQLLGTNMLSGMAFNDTVDLAGTTNATLSGNVISTTYGTLVLNSAPSGYSYRLIGDANGGTEVVLNPNTPIPSAFAVSAGGSTTYSAGSPYVGSVNYLQMQYVYSGTADATIVAGVPNAYILGGSGNDTLQALSGNNLLDGGTGTNVLIGGTGSDGGRDSFSIAPGTGTVNDTLVNFHQGDTAVLFGFQAGTSTETISPTGGSAPYQGVTLTSSTTGAGGPVNATITFAGISQATEAAHFTFTNGTNTLQITYT